MVNFTSLVTRYQCECHGTASCRMFPAGRQALWEEKLGLAPKFAGNAATRWGTRQEADALLRQGAMLKCTVCTVCWPQHTGHL